METTTADQPARFADLQLAEQPQGYAHRRFLVTGPVDRYTDKELLEFCNYIPYFGGRIHRAETTAVVIVHTD